jgi:tRNA nucleotidyltransferase (CCA-adding enzyme)
MLDKAKQIIARIRAAGASEVLLVGGFVRDQVLGLASKDIDMEVYGLSYPQIEAALASHHDVRRVGEAFGVLKVDNTFDVSVPRRENKIGAGHKGFAIEADPTLSPQEAARRRDFTMNSLAMTGEGTILDFFGGLADLRAGVLRATSAAFLEDPLRVLRAMQFAGRFGLSLSSDTVALCRQMLPQYQELPKERLFEEWWKWAVKSRQPSRGLAALLLTEWDAPYPMLRPLAATPQDPHWHPEGDVWIHTLHVCDAAAEVADREALGEDARAVLLFAALCHDLGKPATTQKNAAGRWVSPDHAAAGVPLTLDFLDRIGAPLFLRAEVAPLVREHMAHVATPEPSPRVVRRLAMRLAPATVRMWSHLVEADHSGRPPLPKSNPVGHWVELADQLAVTEAKPQPLVLGRHLLPLGWEAGPELGDVLKQTFEAQLDGAFADVAGGVEWVLSHFRRRPPSIRPLGP